MASEGTGEGTAMAIEVLVERNDTDEGITGHIRDHDRGQDHHRAETKKSNRAVTFLGAGNETATTMKNVAIVIAAVQDPQIGEDGTDGPAEVPHHLSVTADSSRKSDQEHNVCS